MQTSRKKIFILGSGLVSEPAIDYLLCREENFILVGSNCEKELSSLKEKKLKKNPDYEKRIEFFVIDAIKDKVLLNKTVSECDIVISLIPEVLQVYIAKCCVENNKNLVTTSNITKDIQKFAKKALEKNLVFMFEAGVNPGLDHIIAFKVLQEQSELGNIIVGYESWVGAIPSPECLDNPLLYKFSWSPKDALLSLTHNAKQLINGKVVNINEKVLLTHHLVDKKFHPSLNFEGYYNGDSLMYKDLYNLQHAKNVIRGIFRYQGFSFVIQCFKFLNLFSFERIDPKFQTWREYINKTLKNPRIQDSIYEVKNKYLKKGLEMFVVNPKLSDSISERMFYFNLCLLALSYFDDKYIRKYGFETLFNRIYSVFIFLEFYKEDNKVKFS